ncbi:hypothetical protein C2E20_2818 isoform B [Micractinium conductrix]|nr:hypothetical protein C2E20_2818 isoform A [Micractinium conductrix]PSC74138.1 hypothetical protein C2E20_2818 isoform B [Micractinium conductrix]|eukprot:PSC74137.1 hypothetical protein C2E20_2818 isoform A [Micractinium conductrix]
MAGTRCCKFLYNTNTAISCGGALGQSGLKCPRTAGGRTSYIVFGNKRRVAVGTKCCSYLIYPSSEILAYCAPTPLVQYYVTAPPPPSRPPPKPSPPPPSPNCKRPLAFKMKLGGGALGQPGGDTGSKGG